jgi:hypothetical protein
MSGVRTLYRAGAGAQKAPPRLRPIPGWQGVRIAAHDRGEIACTQVLDATARTVHCRRSVCVPRSGVVCPGYSPDRPSEEGRQ